MKYSDFTHLGGLKGTQNRLAFMQDGYNEMFAAMAKLCGNKTILHGVEVDGSNNVSSGWIAVNGEMIRFIGGTLGTDVVFSTAITLLVFADGNTHDVHFDKTATCGSVGAFPFADLQTLSTVLANKVRLDAAESKLLKITHHVSYFQKNYPIGDIAFDKILTITIPDQGTVDYIVGGTLKGLNTDLNFDNDVMFIVGDLTNTNFKIAIKEIGTPVQDLVFDFTITKAF